MRRSSRELWAALAAILVISAVYLFVVINWEGAPRASGLFGHGIGIFGFVLMLMTETLYTLRKRSRKARWGRMSAWLSFHIFTGIVGPYMVLLHSSWKFHGLAGLVFWMTALIVASGFIGRYIYTAVPRTADGVEVEASLLEAQIASVQAELQGWLQARPEAAHALGLDLAAVAVGPGGHAAASAAALPRPGRLKGWLARRRLDPATRRQAGQLDRLLRRQDLLNRQLASLAMARRLLALWHAVHIPIGMALFTAAFIHILAAIYYATLLK